MASNLNESQTEFLDLDDNCLEHVFNFCDVQTIVSVSKVCKRINALVTTVHFPKQTKFKYFGLHTWPENNCSEEQFIEILNRIGQYLVDLELHYTEKDYLGDPNIALYEKIGRLVGDRIRKLTIDEIDMTDELFQAIKPVLQHLEELKV